MTTVNSSTSYTNHAATTWRLPRTFASPRIFHQSMPEYQPSPLRELPEIAAELGIGKLFVKDESNRLGLPAFKILGASWAVCTALSQILGTDASTMTLASLRGHLEKTGLTRMTLVTATDGNHGRAVSHMASLLGMKARVYIPTGISQAATRAIAAEGAELIELEEVYDNVVAIAAESTSGHDDELLIQDTSWPGYTEVPQWIIEGYMTLFGEIDEQLSVAGLPKTNLVACPVGVGSLAQAMVEYYRGNVDSNASLLSVEPMSADCVLQSLKAGEKVSVDTSTPTMMAGLNCGTPSEIAWPSLLQGLNAAVSVTEEECRLAVHDLSQYGQYSGPCGAAPLAGLRKLIASADAKDLGINGNSVVVLISTEGIEANPLS